MKFVFISYKSREKTSDFSFGNPSFHDFIFYFFNSNTLFNLCF